MDTNTALEGFGALAQDTRLAAFRMLVVAGPDGLPAGIIAERLATPANTLSTHLAILTRAGLASARREGRQIIYSADMAGARALIGYLVEDCCGGHPEACAPLLDAAIPNACCPPAPKEMRP